MDIGSEGKPKPWVALLGVLAPVLVAVLPRLPALQAARSARPFDKYLWAADQLAGGGDLGVRLLDYSPLYLQLHILVRRLASDPAAFLLGLHFALGVGATLLIYAAGKRVGGMASGLVAATLYSLHATVLAYELTLEPEAISLFCLTAMAFLGAAGRGRGALLVLGLAFGLALSNRPNVALLGPFLLAAVLFRPGPDQWRPRWILRLGLVAVGALVGLIPMASTLRAGSGGLFDSMSSGQVFHQGTSTEAKSLGVEYPSLFHEMPETFARGGDYAHETYRIMAAADLGHPVTPAESDHLWRERAWSFARTFPGAYARLELRKLVLFFSGVEVHDVGETTSLLEKMRPRPPLSFAWLAAIGLAGAAICLRDPRRHFIPLGILAVYLLSALILFVSSRQRLPVSIPLALLGAHGLIQALRTDPRRGRRLATFGAVFVVVLLLPNLDRSTRAGYEAGFQAMRASEPLYAAAGAAYGKGRIDVYRGNILQAAAFSPKLLSLAPSLPVDALVAARDSVSHWIDQSLPGLDEAERKFFVGFFLLETGDWNGAYAALEGLENHGWFRQTAAELRARAAFRLHGANEALSVLQAVNPPSLAGGALRLAILEQQSGTPPVAERSSLEGFHGETAVLYFKGLADLWVGNGPSADRELAEFLRRIPNIPRALLGRAEARRMGGDAAGAVALFEAARRVQPGAFARSADMSTAYRELYSQSPSDRELATRLGEILRHEGRGAESRDVLAPVVRAAPGDFNARGQLVRTLIEMGLEREARIAARPPLGVSPR